MNSKNYIININSKSSDDLKLVRSELFREYFSLKMQSFSNDFKKNHLLKLIRKNIARVNTVLSLR
jgi:ribosomal protein L29